jgi:hypothetical protein
MRVEKHVNGNDDGRDESEAVNPCRLPRKEIPPQFNARQALCLHPPQAPRQLGKISRTIG